MGLHPGVGWSIIFPPTEYIMFSKYQWKHNCWPHSGWAINRSVCPFTFTLYWTVRIYSKDKLLVNNWVPLGREQKWPQDTFCDCGAFSVGFLEWIYLIHRFLGLLGGAQDSSVSRSTIPSSQNCVKKDHVLLHRAEQLWVWNLLRESTPQFQQLLKPGWGLK